MFQIKINGVPVIMSKFFAVSDREAVLAAIPQGTGRVVFIDTPATEHLVATIEDLVFHGVQVFVRDHHDAPARSNPREVAIADAADKIRLMIGGNAIISDRKTNPACSSVLKDGEFELRCSACESRFTNGYCPATEDGSGHVQWHDWIEDTVIVADPDPDGLTASMKAVGVTYEGLDADADVLDGGRAGQTADRLTPNALLLTKAMATLPAFDANRPQVSEDAKAKLFSDFVAVVQGNADAKTRLEKGVEVYEAGVREAERLATTVVDIIPGLAFVDLMSAPRFDLGTLAAKMEARSGAKVTVQKKSFGPIAAKHGVQFSLAVVKAHQADINLQSLLPAGFVSSPETGIISNTSFLLHVSEQVWNEVVLPALRARLANTAVV